MNIKELHFITINSQEQLDVAIAVYKFVGIKSDITNYVEHHHYVIGKVDGELMLVTTNYIISPGMSIPTYTFEEVVVAAMPEWANVLAISCVGMEFVWFDSVRAKQINRGLWFKDDTFKTVKDHNWSEEDVILRRPTSEVVNSVEEPTNQLLMV